MDPHDDKNGPANGAMHDLELEKGQKLSGNECQECPMIAYLLVAQASEIWVGNH